MPPDAPRDLTSLDNYINDELIRRLGVANANYAKLSKQINAVKKLHKSGHKPTHKTSKTKKKKTAVEELISIELEEFPSRYKQAWNKLDCWQYPDNDPSLLTFDYLIKGLIPSSLTLFILQFLILPASSAWHFLLQKSYSMNMYGSSDVKNSLDSKFQKASLIRSNDLIL
jgi:hypothetical protein